MANPGFTDVVVSLPTKGAPAKPEGLYPARSQTLVRAQLVEAIQRREGLVVVTGESGTGKTTLGRSILRSLDPPTFVAEIVNSSITIDDLLKQILTDFGATALLTQVNGASSHELMLAVGRFLDSMPVVGRAILVIDEAHDVRAEVLAQLRTLANLQRADGRSLQLILMGQPALDSLLARPELLPIRQRITRRCQLKPLEDDEIEPYIAHRLGGAQRPSFLASAIRSVAVLSKGVPRTVNLLTDRASEIALERKLAVIGRAEVVESASRSAVPIPIGQRALTRRLAVAATIAIPSIISTWLLVVRVVPFARTQWASRAAVLSPTGSPGSAAGSNPAAATPTPAPAANPLVNAPVNPAPNAPPATVESLQAADSYLVLAGSFKSARNAEATVERLLKLRLPAFWRQDGEWNVVLIGPYVTPEEAREARMQIGDDFPDAYVLRLQVPESR